MTTNDVKREERRVGMIELLTAEKRTKVFITVLIALVTIIAGGIWEKLLSMGGSLTNMEDTISLVLHDSVIFAEYRNTHKQEAKYHIDKIDSNFKAIHNLINNVNARKDGFSGEQAKAMEYRLGHEITSLERRIDKIEQCCGIVKYKSSRRILNFDDIKE